MSIYLDSNATTPLRPEVWEAMGRVEFGPDMIRNPSSTHKAGLAAKRAMRAARERIAGALGAAPEEVLFTGGGSEAINLALKGAVWAAEGARTHVISTQVEHHAGVHALEWLETQGVEATLVPVDPTGRVDPEAVRAAFRPNTGLVSVMYVNNEVGTIQPVEEIGAVCREKGVPFHVDAVQAFGKLPVDVNRVQCDLLSCSAHKLGGPKGVGALYVRKGTALAPLVHGGPQEHHLRAGTENVQGIVGFGEAVRLALEEQEQNWAKWVELREELYRLPKELDAVRCNSHPDLTVPNCVNATFMYCDGMTLSTNLSSKGIYVSTGSACTAGDMNPSHVLTAMGLSDRAAHGAIRFSMNWATTREELTQTVDLTKQLVERLRLITMPEDIGKCGDDCPCYVTG